MAEHNLPMPCIEADIRKLRIGDHVTLLSGARIGERIAGGGVTARVSMEAVASAKRDQIVARPRS